MSQATENGMLVEEYGQYNANNNEKTDIIPVSRSGSEEPEPEQQEQEAEPLANDCMGSLLRIP